MVGQAIARKLAIERKLPASRIVENLEAPVAERLPPLRAQRLRAATDDDLVCQIGLQECRRDRRARLDQNPCHAIMRQRLQYGFEVEPSTRAG